MKTWGQTAKSLPNKHRFVAVLVGLAVASLALGVGFNYLQKTKVAKNQDQNPQLAVSLSLPRSEPVRVVIPKIGVNAPTVELDLQKDGSLAVPKGDKEVGWYIKAPTPGEVGPAIMVGHLDSVNGPAVFYKLKNLNPGDKIEIDRADGSVAIFEVKEKEKVSIYNFPTEKVYGSVDHPALRLLTCEGQFIKSMNRYNENLVVYADLVEVKTKNTAQK